MDGLLSSLDVKRALLWYEDGSELNYVWSHISPDDDTQVTADIHPSHSKSILLGSVFFSANGTLNSAVGSVFTFWHF